MTQAITRKSLYETDFLLWTEETIAKLKARDFDHVDLENLIEEIESLGKSDKKEIKSRLTTLLICLSAYMSICLKSLMAGNGRLEINGLILS